MEQYSIKSLATLSGIKAHTIRVWELRYNLLKPLRAESNFRIYDSEEVKFAIRVGALNNFGFKISKIAQLSREEVSFSFSKLLSDPSVSENTFLNALFIDIINWDEVSFKAHFRLCQETFGFARSAEMVFLPLLRRASIVWKKSNACSSYAGFAETLVRNGMVRAIESLPVPNNETPRETYVLFLPATELHECGLLYSAYTIRANAGNVIYVGSNVNAECVAKLSILKKAQGVVTYLQDPSSKNKCDKYFAELEHFLPESVKIIISGIGSAGIKKNLNGRVQALDSPIEIKTLLATAV